MSNSITSRIAKLEALIALEKKRQLLENQIATLDRQILSLQATLQGEPRPVKAVPVLVSKGKRGRVAKAKLVVKKASTAAKNVKKTKVKKTGKKAGVRSKYKNKILGILKEGGEAGVSVKDIAKKVGAPYRNVYTWFATTGKKVAGIKKVAAATYRLQSEA